MKKSLLISFILIITNTTYSQDKIKISESDVKTLRDTGFSMYEVQSKEVFEYTHLNEIKKLEKIVGRYSDYGMEHTAKEYNKELERFNYRIDLLDRLKNKMDEYVNSPEKHKDKRQILVEAQEIADKYGLKFDKLVSGDSKITSYQPILLTDYSKNCIKNGLVERFYDKVKKEKEHIVRNKPYMPESVKNKIELDSLKQLKVKRKAYVVMKREFDIIGDYEVVNDNFGAYYSGIVDSLGKPLLEGMDREVDPYNKTNNTYKLVMNTSNKKYYYFDMLDINGLNESRDIDLALNMLREIGYKPFKMDEEYGKDYYFKTKTSEIKVDTSLISLLKNNKNFFNEFDNRINGLVALMSQASGFTKKLNNHYRNYRLKFLSGLNSSEIKAWESDKNRAFDLSNKIDKSIQSIYDVNYTLLNKKLDYDYKELMDMIIVSNTILNP